MTELREDGFLDGRLRILQPVHGFRSGADAVMLAAACPARNAETVLELGCGVGVVSLCLARRVPSALITGLEILPEYADLARQNATANGIAMRVVSGSIAEMPPELRAETFDHVIANPPYFVAGTAAADPARAVARQEVTALPQWIEAGLRRLRPGGSLTLILRADRLDAAIAAVHGHAGNICILPIAARNGREAGRVILSARKGGRGATRLLAPFVMHESDAHRQDGVDLSPAATEVLRNAAPITQIFAKLS